MSARVDTTTKLSYLLPTGTFLTFQVLAPLATNNGQCGRTEQILTAVTLAFLVTGCILTSFSESFTAPDGHVYNGLLTYKGLWVPGFNAGERSDSVGGEAKKSDFIDKPNFYPVTADYINAAIAAIAFLSLTMFTDPVCTCFYPNLSETMLKTLPVLLATVLSFCCTFSSKIRHGIGNSGPGPGPGPGPAPAPFHAGGTLPGRDCLSGDGIAAPVAAHDATPKHPKDEIV